MHVSRNFHFPWFKFTYESWGSMTSQVLYYAWMLKVETTSDNTIVKNYKVTENCQ